MDDSFNLARHVARLFSLVARSPESVDQQKLELRTIVLLTRDGTLRLTTRGGELMANGITVPQVLTGVRDLSDQMHVHRVEAIDVSQNAVPGEVLTLARILAEPSETAPQVIRDRLAALDAKTVIVTLADVKEADPTAAEVKGPPEPVAGTPERIAFVLARAARGGDGQPLVPLFEEVAFAAEQAVREGRVADAVRVFEQIVAHEPAATDPEARRQFVLAVRRLTRPHLLYAIARITADGGALRDAALTILVRCGTDGADAVVDMFARAASAGERANAVEVLGQLPAADESLVTMLSDGRPHVARLAADLIGERRPRDGDQALADRLSKADPRVRRAIVRALGRYDTPFAMEAIARGLEDPVVEVRLESVAALARRKGARVGDIIGRAMETEADIEVQVGLISALGRIATADAVAKLARAAEAASGLFGGRKDSTVRVAAARALAEARTPGALSVLNTLVNDKDREVRDVASRAVAR